MILLNIRLYQYISDASSFFLVDGSIFHNHGGKLKRYSLTKSGPSKNCYIFMKFFLTCSILVLISISGSHWMLIFVPKYIFLSWSIMVFFIDELTSMYFVNTRSLVFLTLKILLYKTCFFYKYSILTDCVFEVFIPVLVTLVEWHSPYTYIHAALPEIGCQLAPPYFDNSGMC